MSRWLKCNKMKTVEPFRRTKLIATVTEACSGYNSVRDLALAGVDVFRLTDGYEQMNTRDSTIFEKIRKASGEVSRKLATMLHFNEYEIGIRT
jgi:pyruvate kinase